MMIAFLDLIDDDEDKIRFEELYNEYLGLMYSVAKCKVQTKQDTEDVIQDALLYIAKNFNKVGEIKSNTTKCFVAIITESFAINKFKSETKHQNNRVEMPVAVDLTNEKELDAYDIAELKLVIDTLSDEYRNILYLTYIFGYKSKEIAQIYNMSDSNVRKKIQFAKKEIINKLEKN